MPTDFTKRTGWPWKVPPSYNSFRKESLPCAHLPRITVVTPSFNQAQFLEETIRSVVLQGYPNLEYIVIDGGSTDGSLDIIRRYQSHLSYWISEPDGGQCQALNKGFSLSSGDWLAWLNSDDVYLPGALWTVARTIESYKECEWIVGAVNFTDAELNRVGIFNPVCTTDSWLDFVCTKRRNGTALPQAGSFWSRKSWKIVGELDETLHYAMDHEYWGRLAYHGFRPICLQQSLALFRLHHNAKTAQGEGNFVADEKAVIDKWLPYVSEKDARVLTNYRRTLQLRISLRRILYRINCWLEPLRKIAQRVRKVIRGDAHQDS